MVGEIGQECLVFLFGIIRHVRRLSGGFLLNKERLHERDSRQLMVREYARMQGVPDSFRFAGSERDPFQQIGNGVSIPVGKWIGSEACRYFNAGGER